MSKLLVLLAAVALTGGGREGPVLETELNDRLSMADEAGVLPAPLPRRVRARISGFEDADTFRFHVTRPCVVDIAVITGASSASIGSPGSTTSSPAFLPLVLIHNSHKQLVYWQQSGLPNLYINDFPLPLVHDSFTVQIHAWAGHPGSYSLHVTTQ